MAWHGETGPAADVAIVGGGIIGAVTAYYLTRAGVRVALIERGLIAREASWASAGIISPGGGATAKLDPRHALYHMTQSLYPELIPRLQEESGVDVEFLPCPRISAAFDDAGAATLRADLDEVLARG